MFWSSPESLTIAHRKRRHSNALRHLGKIDPTTEITDKSYRHFWHGNQGHPLKAASWLARTLFAAGDGLKAGDIVLTGALGPMVALTPGEHVLARVAGLGTVSFSYQE
jgi:hypothetical protein